VGEILDLKKQLAHLYKPGAKVPTIVEVPTMRYLMLDGVDDVGGPSFAEAFGALFGLAYPVKFAAGKKLDLSYPVMPAEGLYWDADLGPLAPIRDAKHMAWRIMIMLPDQVPGEFVDEVREKVAAKKDIPRLADVRIGSFTEGTAVQLLHIGPYSEETPTIERMEAFAAEKGFEFAGAHHEIYLGDPNRAKPEKLKTGLRNAVRRTK